MNKTDILIIEDDRSIVRILELELEYEGYTFSSAYDGKAGLEKFHANQYGLILFDLMLPFHIKKYPMNWRPHLRLLKGTPI